MMDLDPRCDALDLKPHHFFGVAIDSLSPEQRFALICMHQRALEKLALEEAAASRAFEESRVAAMVESKVARIILATRGLE